MSETVEIADEWPDWQKGTQGRVSNMAVIREQLAVRLLLDEVDRCCGAALADLPWWAFIRRSKRNRKIRRIKTLIRRNPSRITVLATAYAETREKLNHE